jgi:hypothetical protein
MTEFIGAALFLGYLPGALLFRLPYWQRGTRAALAAEERVFWHVILSVSWSLTLVLALAAFDLYRFDRLLGLTGGLLGGVLLTARGRLLYRGTAARITWTAVLPLMLIGLSLWRFFPVSEYIIGGRDPGVLINEGVQIAQRGSIIIRDPEVSSLPAFARPLFFPRYPVDEYESLRFMGMMVRDTSAGTVVGQFPHLYPASIAIGYGLAGLTGAREAIAWWAVLGVLAVYFAGARWIGQGPAFAAALLLLLHVIQIWFARYPNSDMAMQAGVFAALLAFARAHQDDDAFFGPVAAWVLGLQLFSRVEALLAVLVLGGVVVLQWTVTPGARLRWRFLAPMTVITGVGLLYLTGPMAAYFWRAAVFLENLPPSSVGAALAGGMLLLGGALWLRAREHTAVERWFPSALITVIIGLALYAFFLREPGGKLVAADAYALKDFVGLYLWWPMFALTLAGLVLAARRDFWRDPAFVLVFASFSLFLLYKLKIVPEHFWLARRFLPVILPGALILGCAAALGSMRGPWGLPSVARSAAGAVVLLVVAQHYVVAAAPVIPHVEYRNIIPYVEKLSTLIGPRDLAVLEARDAGSDIHVLGLPLAYIYARPVLVLASVKPDAVLFREFLADALTRYDRVLYVGTGGTSLLSRRISATALSSDRVQIDEFEVTTDRLPTTVRHKEFDYGIYALTLGQQADGPFTLDIGDRDDLHVVRFHAKEPTEGRMIRWTQDASEISVTGIIGTEREVTLTMSDGGRPAGTTPSRVEVHFNGTHLGTVNIRPGFQDYRLAIPQALAEAAAQSDEPATLRLVSTVWSPRALLGVPDNRELGVMLDTVTVR